MSYRPPKKSALVAPVSQRVAVVLAAWLPDDQVFRRTATMPEDLRLEVLNAIDGIKAAALAHRQTFESAEVGNRTAAITPEPESLKVEGTPPRLDPAGVVLPLVDAAGLLSLSETRVRQLCRSGQLDAVKVGIAWTISRDAIDRYLATRKAA
ncbi:helix-turn-helix domain-containing protein [Brevibacterium sp. UCMA 11754]|uniref:helix-turn-helix domain-containing protein n=1 Tax=Brevibacterium sp. UCMA 11754 TaxID=2749198 RepID=UPI001F32B668|nr:helix-turn-helix domain-containing protein [Brevibacterium sp. UCMA 11754]MCF2573152.1 helix-turn-helix domain-containing protein [Brevibacterium sp. UCMA 11754]